MLPCARTSITAGSLFTGRICASSLALLSYLGAAALTSYVAQPAVAQMVADSNTVVAAGLAAPGIPGATIVSLSTPSINSVGTFVIVGTLTGGSITPANNQAMWMVTPSSIFLVLQTGSSVVGGLPTGITVSTIESPTVNANGTIAFLTSLQGPAVTGANTRAVIAGPSGALQLIARASNPPPGLATTLRFNSFSGPRLGVGNLVVFNASIAGQEPNAQGVLRPMNGDSGATMWAGQVGSPMSLVMRSGIAGNVPGIPTARFANFGDANVSEQGILTFHGALILQSPIVTSTTDMVIIRGPVGGFQTVARAGMSVPFLVGSQAARLDGINPVSANGDNEFAFTGTVTPSPTTSSSFMTFRVANNQWYPLVQTGWIVEPGIQVGTVSSPRCSGQSNVLMLSTLLGSRVGPANDQTIWASIPAGLFEIARKGNQAPGCLPGVTFAGFSSYGMNAVGTAAFLCTLSGPLVTPQNDTALVTWNAVDGLRLIGRKGGAYEVTTDDFRTISGIVCNLDGGAEDGRPCSLSSNGLLAFNLAFTDGTQAAVRTYLIRCMADIASDPSDQVLNPNGTVGPEDIEAFLNAYLRGSFIADIASDASDTSRNPNGSVGSEDLEAFVNSFLAGAC